MPDATQEIQNEIKALKADLATQFDDKIKALSAEAERRYAELKAAPDAVTGESLKKTLDEKLALVEQKSATIEAAVTARMDELEAKARRGPVAEDPDAAIERAIEEMTFSEGKFGGKGRFAVPVKAVTEMTNANAGGATFYAPGPGIREYPQDRLSMRDVVLPGTITGSHFKFEREKPDMEGDADYQGGAVPAEGETKPQMDLYTEIVTREVVTIAVFAKVSQQLFDDRPAFVSFLRGRMGYRVRRFLDREILSGVGNGTNGELEGINTIATAYGNAHLTGMDSASQTSLQRLDVLRWALAQVELQNYVPNYIALHPTDLAGIETLKDDVDRYLVGEPRTGGATGRMTSFWGVPVVSSTAQSAGDFTVGDGNASQLFMRQELQVLASTEDGDNFTKNLVTIRAELRALLANYSAVAHVTGDFATAIAAT